MGGDVKKFARRFCSSAREIFAAIDDEPVVDGTVPDVGVDDDALTPVTPVCGLLSDAEISFLSVGVGVRAVVLLLLLLVFLRYLAVH